MPRFAANLSTLFTEVPFLDRFALAREAGFEAVEVQFPYAWAAAEIRERLAAAQLQLVLHNLPAGDWSAGERGIACLPDRRDEFRAGVAQGIAYAQALGVPRLNCLAGLAPPGADTARPHAALVDNLRLAAAACAKAGIELLVEAINTHDVPGFAVHRSAQALRLIEEVGAPNLRLQYDIYHMQRMEGDLAATLQRALPRIGHVQIADNPGRHEPGSGEINYPFLFDWLDRIGYHGWVGCEYVPAAGTREGLAWRERLVPR
jgi:hydroxypyruvate isomerase